MDNKPTWDDILKMEQKLKEMRVPEPYVLKINNPYLLRKWKNYQRYVRRYKRRGNDRASQ